MGDQTEIERCVCGAEATFGGNGSGWYAWCTREDIECWSGPERLTPEGALAAWNTFMRGARKTLHERPRWWLGGVDCK